MLEASFLIQCVQTPPCCCHKQDLATTHHQAYRSDLEVSLTDISGGSSTSIVGYIHSAAHRYQNCCSAIVQTMAPDKCQVISSRTGCWFMPLALNTGIEVLLATEESRIDDKPIWQVLAYPNA